MLDNGGGARDQPSLNHNILRVVTSLQALDPQQVYFDAFDCRDFMEALSPYCDLPGSAFIVGILAILVGYLTSR